MYFHNDVNQMSTDEDSKARSEMWGGRGREDADSGERALAGCRAELPPSTLGALQCLARLDPHEVLLLVPGRKA